MYQQLTQVLTAARLISQPQGATIKELQEKVGISRRSVYRLLENLEELGYGFYDEFDGRERVLRLNEAKENFKWWLPLPKVRLDFDDRVMLDYLLFEAAQNPTLAKSVAALRNKMATLLADGGYNPLVAKSGAAPTSAAPQAVLLSAASLKKIAKPEHASFLKTLLQSIKEKSVCVVSYEAINTGQVRTYKIHPLALFEHQGGVYVFVVIPYYGHVRMLALERIRELELTEEDFAPPPNFDAQQYLQDPFGLIQEDNSFTAKVWFNKQQAAYIREIAWPESTRFTEQKNGALLMTIETAGAYELKRWVASYGPAARLLEPDWLRDELAKDLAKAAEYYKEKPGKP